jgi:hypothetical protein
LLLVGGGAGVGVGARAGKWITSEFFPDPEIDDIDELPQYSV